MKQQQHMTTIPPPPPIAMGTVSHATPNSPSLLPLLALSAALLFTPELLPSSFSLLPPPLASASPPPPPLEASPDLPSSPAMPGDGATGRMSFSHV